MLFRSAPTGTACNITPPVPHSASYADSDVGLRVSGSSEGDPSGLRRPVGPLTCHGAASMDVVKRFAFGNGVEEAEEWHGNESEHDSEGWEEQEFGGSEEPVPVLAPP